MRFGVSNLIWPRLSPDARQDILTSCQVVDFAPTVHYGKWDAVPLPVPPDVMGENVALSGLQSLFFGVPDVSLVKDQQAFDRLRAHMLRVLALAGGSGARCLVLGSPGTRSGASLDLCGPVILERVRALAGDVAAAGLRLCFEVNSPRFGTEFLSANHELFELLAVARHPGLGLHLDTGQMIEEGLEPVEVVSRHAASLIHLHLSAPDFSCRPDLLPLYGDVIRVLRGASSRADVVLEVQSLGDASESDIVGMCRQLRALLS